MSNTTPAGIWTNTFRCGRYICEMTYRHGAGLAAQWTPAVPKAATFSRADMAEYRRGRDALLAEVGAAIGPVIVIEA